MNKVFKPIDGYDVSKLSDNIEAITKEYTENIVAFREYMDNHPDHLSAVEASLSNSSNAFPDVPVKTQRARHPYANGWTSNWLGYNTKLYDPVEKFFPVTYRILNDFGNVFYAQFGALKPRGHINGHWGEKKDFIQRSQWCFIAPSDSKNCYIAGTESLDDNAEVELFHYEKNSSFIFDDAKYYHWIENNTDEERVVLLIDYWTDMSKKKDYDYYLYYGKSVANAFDLEGSRKV